MEGSLVLVVRGDDIFSSLLRDAECEVVNLELIRTVPVDDLSRLNALLERIDDFDGLFFTSSAAADVFVERSVSTGQFFGGKVYAVGETAKTILEKAGLAVVHAANANTAEDLIASFDSTEFVGKRLLFVRGNKSMRTIPDLLSAKAKVDEVVVYETKEIQPDGNIIREITERSMKGEIDRICFFSPSGVNAFRKLFPSACSWTNRIAAIGETTASAARESNFTVDFVSRRPAAEFFATSLIEFIKTH